MKRASLFALAALAGLLGLLVIAAGGLLGAQDELRCRFMLHLNEPNTSTAWIHVPENRQGELIQYARNFAERNNMKFGTVVWEAGAGIDHRSYVIEVCNRFADLSIRNTHEAENFGIHSSRNANYDPDTFNRLYAGFVNGATAKFGAATTPMPGPAIMP